MKTILIVGISLLCLAWALDNQAISFNQQLSKKRVQDFETSRGRVHLSKATGTAHLVTENKNRLSKRSAFPTFEAGLEAFITTYPEIGVTDLKQQLVELSRQQDAHIKSWTMVVYQQVHHGLEVEGCLLKVIFDADNRVVSTSGSLVQDLAHLNLVPSISKQVTLEYARKSLPTDLVFERVSSSLNIHRSLLEQARVGSNHLVYRFIFTSEHHLDEQIVIVDAHNGEILLSDSTHDHALDRKVTLPGEGVLFTEGQQTPDNADIARLLGVSGAVHTVMMNAGGWDGPDLKGGTMNFYVNGSSNFLPQLRCPNAVFVGSVGAMIFCYGMISYDVVGHELSHSYFKSITGFTGSARGQFGSISEAYADILGETVQLLLNKPVEYTTRQPSRACTPAEETTNRRWIALDYLSDPEINIWKVNANQEKIGIRDLYNPNCYSLAETTDDKFVMCDANVDRGGAHSNSGIVSVVYALFVDGGEFHGTTYTGVGLLKAFHVFMRGLAKHTPTAGFTEHASFNEAACNELAQNSVDLPDLIFGEATGTIVTTEDCQVLSSLYAAVKITGPFCQTATGAAQYEANQADPDAIIIAGPYPPLVLHVGEDVVFWRTEDWTRHGKVYCRIDGFESYEGGFFDDDYIEYIYCSMPPFEGTGEIDMYLSYDNSNWDGPYTITVIEEYKLTAYGPVSGPIEGGNTLHIEGEGFVTGLKGCSPDELHDTDDCAVCYFGIDSTGVSMPAIVESETSVRCEVPPFVTTIAGQSRNVEVWVSMNYFLAIGPLPYEYQEGVGPVGDAPLTSLALSFPPSSAPVVKPRSSNSRVTVFSSVLVVAAAVTVLF
jgi:Zn-dependent metalloprotease